MKKIKFIANPELFDDPIAFVAHIGVVNGKEDLLRQVAEHLRFPSYFGCNWDALLDCMRNFEWIEQFKIILVHDEMVQLPLNDFRIYIEILSTAMNEWTYWNEHDFEVVFPSRYEDLIHPYEEKYLVELEKLLKREFQ